MPEADQPHPRLSQSVHGLGQGAAGASQVQMGMGTAEPRVELSELTDAKKIESEGSKKES